MLRVTACLALLAALVAGIACAAPRPRAERLRLATTTSTADSGLLEALLPPFEEARGVRVEVLAVGTGEALELASRGDADVVLVHAKQKEEAFVAQGHGVERREVMYNDFVIVGPPSDPAGVSGASSAAAAFSAIAASRSRMVSRGDDSGTHAREQALWEDAGVKPGGSWYLSVGQGMAATLTLASEKQAYTLSDRATFLAHAARLDLKVLVEGDPALRNVYAVIVVSPERHPGANAELARSFADYLFSDQARAIIGDFGRDRFGVPLFHPLPAGGDY